MEIENDHEAMKAINYLKSCGYTWQAVCDVLIFNAPPGAPISPEILDGISSAVAKGHKNYRCVDLRNWKWCSGLAYWVDRAEQSGATRAQIRQAYLDSGGLDSGGINTR